VRSFAPERPKTLAEPPDETTLEQVIGELQSSHGVPQYPQEYRITVKVAEERANGREQPRPPGPAAEDGAEKPMPKREKAPAAPRMPAAASGADEGGRKRRRRRRRRGHSARPGGDASEGSSS
jgi:hypothetical protein